jgi:hypothetical protein
MNLPSIFNNKYFFYFLFALEILQLIKYISEQKYKCIFIVLCTTYSLTCMFKNKSLAILIAMFVTSFFSHCSPL